MYRERRHGLIHHRLGGIILTCQLQTATALNQEIPRTETGLA